MTWVRLDEKFADHPKVVRAGPLGMAMHVTALCYCNRHLTDGFVPKQIASVLLDLTGLGEWSLVVEDLVEAGLWEPVDRGWLIHDYLDYQPSRAYAESVKNKRKQAGSRGGLAKAKQRASNGLANGPAKSYPDTVTVSKKDNHPSGDRRTSNSASLIAEQLVGVWNEVLGERARLTKGRIPILMARFREDGEEGWRAMCERVAASRFLSGGNDRGWKATLGWAMKAENFTKIMEGAYDPANGGGDYRRDMVAGLADELEAGGLAARDDHHRGPAESRDGAAGPPSDGQGVPGGDRTAVPVRTNVQREDRHEGRNGDLSGGPTGPAGQRDPRSSQVDDLAVDVGEPPAPAGGNIGACPRPAPAAAAVEGQGAGGVEGEGGHFDIPPFLKR